MKTVFVMLALCANQNFSTTKIDSGLAVFSSAEKCLEHIEKAEKKLSDQCDSIKVTCNKQDITK
jgi:hypothetical protein